MPFTKHIIEPNNIAQCPIPPGEPNELECLSNLTLANVIRQLSSLGLHAGRIFNELTAEAVKINERSKVLCQRTENLKVKCAQLDLQTEEVSLADFHDKKQFKSSTKIDQQVVCRATMPEAMRKMYESADPPPALDKLNPYRTDGKDCMKFYTDPEFFFNIWYNELMKDNQTRMNDKKRRKTKGEKAAKSIDKALNAQNLADFNNMQQQQQLQQQQQQLLLLQQQQQKLAGMDFNQQQQQQQLQQQQLLLMQQQQLAQYNQQQQAMILNQANAAAVSLITSANNMSQVYQSAAVMKQQYDYEQSLPSPPASMMMDPASNPNFSSTNGSMPMNGMNLNGAMNSQLMNGGAKKSHMNTVNNHQLGNDRPVQPPPPVPNQGNELLPQIMRNINLNGSQPNDNHNNGDLPPPPILPDGESNGFNNGHHHHHHHNQHFNGNSANFNDNIDSGFDMPLPPPPASSELQDPMMSASSNHFLSSTLVNNSNASHSQADLPPPPALPPLVEPDTTSSSTSSLSMPHATTTTATATATTKTVIQAPNSVIIAEETKSARSRFLDDINERRYQLKSTQRDSTNANGSSLKEPDSKNLQPFVNNSDVAAIIDFIRKYRPHVEDSSDEEEENSDWDP